MNKVRWMTAAALPLCIAAVAFAAQTGSSDADALKTGEAAAVVKTLQEFQHARLQRAAIPYVPIVPDDPNHGKFACHTGGSDQNLSDWMNATCDPNGHFALGGNTSGNDYATVCCVHK